MNFEDKDGTTKVYIPVHPRNCHQVCFCCGLFQEFKFSLIISWLFQGARKDIPRNTLMFLVGLRRPNIRIGFFLAFYGDFCETLDRIHVKYPVKYVLPEGAKTVATCVQKVGSIWLKGGFLLQLFRAQM